MHKRLLSVFAVIVLSMGLITVWVPYLRDTSDEELIEEYIEDLQKKEAMIWC